MSIAFDGCRRLGSSGSSRGGASYASSIFQLPEDDRVVADGGGEVLARNEGDDLNACTCSSASSSSSIGRNSDLSGRSSDGEGCGENEVQSAYQGPLDAMESLEEVLPMRRGISNFYSGKSKSFTSLAEAATTASVKEIVKPENAYTRKRRSQLALNLLWDRNRTNNGVGISKRFITSSRSLLAMAVTSSSSSESNGSGDSNSCSSSRSPPRRPPLHPQARISNPSLAPSSSRPRRTISGRRSYSLADLHQ